MENNENIIVNQKSNKGLIIVLVLIIIILLGLVGYLAYDKFMVKDATPSSNNAVPTDNNINNDETASIKNFLDTNIDYLKTYYSDVSKIDMERVLRYNFKLCDSESNFKGSTDYYLEIKNKKYSLNDSIYEGSIYLCDKEKVDESFKNVTGSDISTLSSSLLPMYSDLDGAYFFNTSDAFINNINIVSINTNTNGECIVKYNGEDIEYENIERSRTKQVTLRKTVNSYQIVSNIPVKE